ncbi:MAG: branched-chain amino acid transport system II carrier protein [Flavobacteriaceae bacterium]
MKLKNEVIVTGLALFSMFFGAGNLILPPYLGAQAGNQWLWVVIGFFITAVFIPVLAILTHAKLQGTMADFAKKIGPKWGIAYAVLMYAIAIALPTPRTAAVTHEIAIAPFFHSSSLITSAIYFALVLLFALNRSTVIDALGKYLTPLIVLILAVIIGVAIFYGPGIAHLGTYESPVVSGLLEGYQTFDAIGGAVAGGVLIVSMKIGFPHLDYKGLRNVILKSGLIAGAGLFLIYAGLIYAGANYNGTFDQGANNVEVLLSLSQQTLGGVGNLFLGILVSLACFTTAVGIVTGTSDYAKTLFGGSNKAFKITAIVSCVLGVLIGQLNVDYILKVAIPAIYLAYPVTIGLILLNLVPNRYATKKVFSWVIAVVFLFSLPDVIGYFSPETVAVLYGILPLAKESLAWLIPGLLTFIIVNLLEKKEVL